MIKAKPWSGKDLKGDWEVTSKRDGVRALWNAALAGWYSRNDKPLYNLPPFAGHTDCEAYCGSFKETIEKVRAKTKARAVHPSELYSLVPVDPRLILGYFTDPSAITITHMMNVEVAKGNEGLVLRQGDTWLKVKTVETYDVLVTDVIEGEGKHKGRMGALMTPMGKVGTGFTDAERTEWWAWFLQTGPTRSRPRTVEVECMKLTDDGKFRHPRFLHIRIDK